MRILAGLDRLFLLIVVLPTLFATAYFGFMASDVYVVKSSFVVRSPQQPLESPLGMMLKGVGFSNSQDDSYMVQAYMESLDAVRGLDKDLHMRRIFTSRDIDALSRFPGLYGKDTFENFQRYYVRHIADVQIDTTSSIATLTTRAFSARDAYLINQRLLDLSETLVNQMNERGRQDMIRFAKAEADAAEQQARDANVAVGDYRNAAGVIDPEKQSSIPLQQAGKLQESLVATKIQIAQLEQVARDNPQLPVLRRRAVMLESELGSENAHVAGAGETSLAGKATKYEVLQFDNEFSSKLLASAMSSLEQARAEAARKQLYLEKIVQPSIPDAPAEPKRATDIFTTFIIAMIIWGIASLLIAGVKEHHD